VLHYRHGEVGKVMTVNEYLESEKHSEVRHEYVDGALLAMAGEKKRHNRIAFKVALLLDPIAEARGCEVFIENIKVRTKDTKYRYPDVVITCEINNDEYTVFEPCALFEVLSESTEETDTSTKLEEYLKLPSLQRYVMLRQNERSAIVYKRGPDGWQVEFLEADGEVSIPCLDTTLKLEQVYAGLV
jgi:Uma2 family endonuclease